MKLRSSLQGLLLLFVVCGTSSRAAAQVVYNVATDFSLSSNPNGVWSYGTTGTTLTGPLTLFTSSTTAFIDNPNFSAWVGTETAFGNFYPAVAKNTAATNQVGGGGFVPLLPGQLFITPGPSGAYGVSRFTAPAAGLFTLAALFQGRDTRGTSTDVHILHNGVSIFDGIVTGFDTPSNQSFSTQLTLSVGDRLDFAVGFGPNMTFFQDSTALAATLTPVPEPASLALIVLPAAAWFVRRRRMAS